MGILMRTLFLSLIGLLQSFMLFAQTNYYTDTKVFSEDGYTYRAEVWIHGAVELYNTANLWKNTNSVYKDTGEIFNMPDYGIDLIEHTGWLRAKKQVVDVVNSSFSDAEKQRIKDDFFIIRMYVNSTTGCIDDVYFEFRNDTPYATVPVSVYRKIELELKEKVKFTLTDEGRKLNYVYYWQDVTPE